MNALPVIMAFLFNKYYNEKNEITFNNFKIKKFLKFGNCVDKIDFIKVNKIYNIKGLEDKTIIIKKNNISISLDMNKYKLKNEGDSFDFKEDYILFFNENKVKSVIFENNNIIIKDFNNIKNNIINSDNIFYKIDFKTLNNAILEKNFCSFSFLVKKYNLYFTISENKEITNKIDAKLLNVLNKIKCIFFFLTKIKNKITFIINNIKERKELYILLCIYKELPKEDNIIIEKFKYEIYNKIRIKLDKHFLRGINEENREIYNKINYYYISEDEEKIFGEIGKEKKEIIFDKFKFKIEYDNKSENFWDILYS